MGVGASEGVLLCLGAVGGSGRSGGLEAHASCLNSWERHIFNVLSVRSRTSILPPFAGCRPGCPFILSTWRYQTYST